MKDVFTEIIECENGFLQGCISRDTDDPDQDVALQDSGIYEGLDQEISIEELQSIGLVDRIYRDSQAR